MLSIVVPPDLATYSPYRRLDFPVTYLPRLSTEHTPYTSLPSLYRMPPPVAKLRSQSLCAAANLIQPANTEGNHPYMLTRTREKQISPYSTLRHHSCLTFLSIHFLFPLKLPHLLHPPFYPNPLPYPPPTTLPPIPLLRFLPFPASYEATLPHFPLKALHRDPIAPPPKRFTSDRERPTFRPTLSSFPRYECRTTRPPLSPPPTLPTSTSAQAGGRAIALSTVSNLGLRSRSRDVKPSARVTATVARHPHPQPRTSSPGGSQHAAPPRPPLRAPAPEAMAPAHQNHPKINQRSSPTILTRNEVNVLLDQQKSSKIIDKLRNNTFTSVEKLKDTITELRLSKELKKTKERADYLDDQSRRKSLARCLRTPTRHGNTRRSRFSESCETNSISQPRLKGPIESGKKEKNKPRDIVAKFLRFQQREYIHQNRRKLANTFIYEDLCPASVDARKKQMDQLMAAREQGKLAYFSYRTLVIKEKSIKPKSTPNMTQPAPSSAATPPRPHPPPNHVSVTRPPPTASSAAPTSGSGSTETTRDHDTAHSANDLSETTWPTHTGAVPKRSTDGTHDVEETLPLEGATGPFASTDASCPSQRRVQRQKVD
ncbi:hypothetical protein C7M84_014018 [Penaeus vannamei]|uniref:Uncharacterized protein n=1 Tax=Penaeus vannamei TaxID=6689 RepID=A0A3R7Q3W2_PENVA|nr:hypothetical protein C7M84_014018 [Penaeus vannamei]